MDTMSIGQVPLLLPSSPENHDDNISDRTHSNTASARNSTHGSDGIFDRNPLRSPINGSESEYEDEDDLISEMPIESQAPSCYGDETQEHEAHDFLQYTPSGRSPFRNPSSVRGMQLETTPPHMRSPTRESMNKHHNRLSIGSRNSTPRSIRSYRSGSPTKLKAAPKKENLLVLLHVTILPISCPYSQDILQDIAPLHILQNWKLLREKVPDTVLERGILIPHPREEFELLEERLLESLELALPRILKCGHFHREATDDEESGSEEQQTPHVCHDQEDDSEIDSDVCMDCTRHIRDGSKGSNGTGKRRWNIRIYAANGLMRAGAWSAAWKEMERVDVEISPWMDDSLRRDLDLRRIQEQEDHERQVAEDQHAKLHFPTDVQSSPSSLDEERRREIYGDVRPTNHLERNFTGGDIVEAYTYGPVDGQADDFFEEGEEEEEEGIPHPPILSSSIHRDPASIRMRKRERESQSTLQQKDVPTSELLVNYIKLLLQDRRNFALAILSIVVLWLALKTVPSALPNPADALAKVPEVAQEQIMSLMPDAPVETVLASVSEGVSNTFADKVVDILPTSLVGGEDVQEDNSGNGNESVADPVIDMLIEQP